MAHRLKAEQGTLEFTGWGGKRPGAGRPKNAGAKLRHAPRPRVTSHQPALVTLRALHGAPNLRSSAAFGAVEQALEAVKEARRDFRVVHFSAMTNHLHLIVEANDADALSRGMQGLSIRAARGVNRAAGRKGKLWADRFHARVLRSPREVRNAICYVLQNLRRHATTERTIVDPRWIDPRSSAPWFDGWRGGTADGHTEPSPSAPPTSAPRSWLLATGWRGAGLIRVDEVPRAATRAAAAQRGR